MIRIRKLGDLTAGERKSILERAEEQVNLALEPAKKVLDDVRARGDDALLEHTLRFDEVALTKKTMRLSKGEIDEAYGRVDGRLLKALKHAHRNITRFHRKQMPEPMWMKMEPGVEGGRLVVPVESAGLYVPGGKAFYPSVMLMLAVPAKVAGVERVVACTPPRRDGRLDPASIVAADISGVDEVYKVGGVQSIAAMAYGTETIKKVDVIAGPGSPYVSAAQRLVKLDVRMDFPAGPSEGMVLADSKADPKYVAADVLSEAEHGPDSAGVLVTDSMRLAKKVAAEIRPMFEALPEERRRYVRHNMATYSIILVADSMEEAIGFVNEYAAEHLVINTKDPKKNLKKIRNAGTICLGGFTPITAGNFMVGPNAILPTGGYAKQFSGVSVDTFLKKPTVEYVTRKGLEKIAKDIIMLSDFEGFPAHSNSVKVRLK